MVVAVPRMSVVQMIADEIVDMTCMRHGMVAASFAVDMVLIVHSTGMCGRATARVVAGACDFVLHDGAVLGVMQVAVVEIVHMTVVAHCEVATARAVNVLVFAVWAGSRVRHGALPNLSVADSSGGLQLCAVQVAHDIGRQT